MNKRTENGVVLVEGLGKDGSGGRAGGEGLKKSMTTELHRGDKNPISQYITSRIRS